MKPNAEDIISTTQGVVGQGANSEPSNLDIAVDIAVRAASHGHDVPTNITYLFAAILVMMIAALALEEKIHAKKSVITGVFAVTCLILGSAFHLLPFGDIILPNGEMISIPSYIPAVDWGVICIIVGSGIFIDVTSRSGLFTWVAIKLTKLSQGDPLKLLWFYGIMTVVFSAVLNNVTAMIIVGSLTGVSLNKLKLKEKLLGFLLIEGLLTNIGGLLTLISSVPNIIVGNAAGISFITFFVKASPYVLVATVATIMMGAKLFKIEGLTSDEQRAECRKLVSGFDENDGIDSRGFFIFASVMLLAFIVVIATTSVLPVIKPLGMGFVAMAFGVVMLIRFKSSVDQFYKAIDWDLIIFFISLFVIINVMEHAQVLSLIGVGIKAIIGDAERFGQAALLVSSAGFSSVTDNIPLAAMLAKILVADPQVTSTSPLWWCVVFGANLGGNITPIGSASTLVAVTIIHKQKLKMSFGGFVIKALPYALMQLALACAYVLFVLN